MQEKSHVNHSITSNKQEKEVLESRRSFMKKAAYAAPTLVAFGTLSRPTDAKAGLEDRLADLLGIRSDNEIF